MNYKILLFCAAFFLQKITHTQSPESPRSPHTSLKADGKKQQQLTPFVLQASEDEELRKILKKDLAFEEIHPDAETNELQTAPTTYKGLLTDEEENYLSELIRRYNKTDGKRFKQLLLVNSVSSKKIDLPNSSEELQILTDDTLTTLEKIMKEFRTFQETMKYRLTMKDRTISAIGRKEAQKIRADALKTGRQAERAFEHEHANSLVDLGEIVHCLPDGKNGTLVIRGRSTRPKVPSDLTSLASSDSAIISDVESIPSSPGHFPSTDSDPAEAEQLRVIGHSRSADSGSVPSPSPVLLTPELVSSPEL